MSPLRRVFAATALATAIAAAPAPAHAQEADPFARAGADDVVVLRDGSVLFGRIVERVAGDHVTLRLEDGQLRRILWASLQPRDVTPASTSTSSVSGWIVFGSIGGVVMLGGGGTLIGSLFVHDPPRSSMQIGGGVALGTGLAVVLIAGAVQLAKSFVVR